jgi:hypothetical protein
LPIKLLQKPAIVKLITFLKDTAETESADVEEKSCWE